MFDWKLMLLIGAACIPGIVITVPKAMKLMEAKIAALRSGGRKVPRRGVIVALQIVQSVITIFAVSALGVAVSRRTGLHAPFFRALITGSGIGGTVSEQLLPAFGAGAAGASLFLLLYYLVFRRIMDNESVAAMEGLRTRIGIAGRIFYGGVVEEVLTRWGLMNVLAWLLALIAGDSSPVILWTALIVSGVLFGLGHLPAYLQAGCRKTPALFATMLVLNLWGSVIFGWLFMGYGLFPAMIAHALFHAMWYPFDRIFARRLAPSRQPA